MREALRAVFGLLALSATAFEPAFGHGAMYRPPGADVTGPGSAGAPTTGRSSGASTGAALRKSSASLDRWEAWWYFQREEYLPRHTVGRAAARTGARGFLTGRGKDQEPQASPLLPDDARSLVLPVLVAALRDQSTEVVDAAAIAIGRSVTANACGPFLGPLEKTLQHRQRTPQQAAVLGLGIMGGPEAAVILREILLDTASGRSRCGATGPLDDLLRGLAALALGLTGQRDDAALLAQVAHDEKTPRDISAAAVLALGALVDAAPLAAVELVKLLENDALDRQVRAQVPIALMRLPGTRGLLPRMCALLAGRQMPDEVTRSLAIAVGNLGLPEEEETIALLLTTAGTHRDLPTRNFAVLGLGRIFEHNEVFNDAARALRQRTQEYLLQQIRDTAPTSMRPFAALALGLIGRGDRNHSRDGKVSSLSQFAASKLEELLPDESNPSVKGALAIAMALIGSPHGGAKLRAELDATRNPVLQSHLCIALGLAHELEAVPKLRELLADRSVHPGVRIDVARALGLLQDRGFEEQLLALLEQADDLPQAAAFAKAIGLLGSKRSAAALVALAQRKDLPEFRRAFAVVALGLLAEKTEQPWNLVYLVDANFTTLPRPLQEVFDLL